jgi:parallel beta-helix repeat protein
LIAYLASSAGNGDKGAHLRLKNVRVQHNRAHDRGAGLYQSGASLTLLNVMLSENDNHGMTGGEGLGGGLFAINSSVNITNSSIAYNYAEMGGGIGLLGGSLVVNNSILWLNLGPEDSGRQIYSTSVSPVALNHTLFRNDSGDLAGTSEYAIDQQSFSDDPLFVGGPLGEKDLRLQAHSPAINAGRNQLYNDAGGTLASDTDLGGQPRLFTGGSSLNIDLGAYEFQGEPLDLHPPQLMGPSHDAYPVALDGRLTWRAVADAERYQVQLAAITSGPYNPFNSNLIDETVTGLSIDLSGLAHFRIYEWRVRSLSGDLAGAWSEVRRFTTVSNFRAAPGNVMFVEPGRAGSNGSGSSWTHAANDLDDVLKWAHLHRDDGLWTGESPLQVWVAGANHRPRYRPDTLVGPFNSLNASFLLVRDVQVYGGFTGVETDLAQRDPLANPTFLSTGSAYYNLVIGVGELGVARLDGFILHQADARSSTTITVHGETISRNSGGGIYLVNSSPVLANLVVRDNRAEDMGGGIFVQGGQPRLINVEIRDNEVNLFGGAGIYNSGAELTLVNGLIAGNQGGQMGGGMMNNGGRARLVNVTIANNHSLEGGGLYNAQSEVLLHNSVLWGNDAIGWGKQLYDLMTGLTITEIDHSIFRDEPGDMVEGDTLTVMNSQSIDPLMVEPEAGNYRLGAQSPGIAAGSSSLYTAAGGDLDNDRDLDGRARLGAAGLDLGGYQWPVLQDRLFRDRFEMP